MLKDQLTELIAQSMKSGDKQRTETLRLIKAELLKIEKDYPVYTEELEQKALVKMVNAHKDSISQFAGRQDLIDKEEAELKIIQEFAPNEASEEDIIKFTKIYIESLAKQGVVLSMRNMGDILREVKVKYPTADGKLVSSVLKTYL